MSMCYNGEITQAAKIKLTITKCEIAHLVLLHTYITYPVSGYDNLVPVPPLN